MDEKPERTRSRTGPIAALLFLAAVVVYPLSEGLAWRMMWADRLDGVVYDAIYAPLDWLSFRSELLYNAHESYLHLWFDPVYDEPLSDREFSPQ